MEDLMDGKGKKGVLSDKASERWKRAARKKLVGWDICFGCFKRIELAPEDEILLYEPGKTNVVFCKECA